jgi:Uma2 family endonuclease
MNVPVGVVAKKGRRLMATTEDRAEPEFPPHRMTIERYERMVEAGVYGDKHPVFLWKGRLVEPQPKSRPYSFASSSLLQILVRMLPEGWHAAYRVSLKIGLDSMPEPDLMVVRGEPRDYLERSRTARDVAIVIEVSDSSVALDLNELTKQRAYAGDGVPVYWIVDLPNRSVMVYSDPSGPSEKPFYRWDGWHGPDDEVPVVLDGREVGRISAKEILP